MFSRSGSILAVRHLRLALLPTLVLCVGVAVQARGATAGSVSAPDLHGFALDLVRAAPVDDAEPDEIRARRLLAEARAVAEGVRGRGPSYRHARRLDRAIRDRFLRTYREDADSVLEVVRHGRFNCLSGSLVYALVARAAGYRVQLLESPTHVLLELEFRDRLIVVETTEPHGFDAPYRASRPLTGVPDASEEAVWIHLSAAPTGVVTLGFREIPMEAATGLVHLNRAVRALEARRPHEIARHVLEATDRLTDLDRRFDEIGPLLGRAFRDQYEHGRFDAAWDLARVECRVYPWSTSARDRLAAAASKRIEALIDRGEAPAAWDVLETTADLLGSGSAVTRLELRVCPLIAASAARAGYVDLADRAVERYAAHEPDPVESERLRAWIRFRTGVEDPSTCVR